MGFINQGSQFVTFDFKHKAKGSYFNKLNRNVIRPGIYSGLKITYVGNNVYISAGTSILNCAYGIEDNLQVKINFDSVYDYGVINPSTLGQNEILYLEYEYGEVTENYADFRHTSYNSFDFDNENLVIIGEIIYDVSYNISSISYVNRTLGFNNADLNYAIPDSTKYYNILNESKFFTIDGSQLPTGTRKINIPNFTESEGDLLITNTSNTTIIKNDLSIARNISSNVNITQNLAITGNIVSSGNLQVLSYAIINDLTQSNNSDTGALVVHGGVGIQKNLNVDGETNITDFLNVNKTTNLSSLDLVSTSGNITANFTNVDISFVTLNNAGSTTIILSVPLLTGNKTRELKLFVKSNGNYTFQNSTSQGSIIYWKTTSNTLGSQPTWLAFDNIVDAHTFIYDGSKLYHIETYSYVVSITAPSNLNYSSNTFDLITYTTHTLIPTLTGTYPMIFSNPTSNLSSGVSLDSNTGNITAYRTNGIASYVTSTIRATNSSGFTDRSINIRFSHNNSSMTRGSQTIVIPPSFLGGYTIYYNGYNTITSTIPFQEVIVYPFGSLSNTNVIGNPIKTLWWTFGGLFQSYNLSLIFSGNTTSVIGSLTIDIGGYTFTLNQIQYNNDPIFGGFNNTTQYSPSAIGGDIFNTITQTDYNNLNNLSNPISIRIY